MTKEAKEMLMNVLDNSSLCCETWQTLKFIFCAYQFWHHNLKWFVLGHAWPMHLVTGVKRKRINWILWQWKKKSDKSLQFSEKLTWFMGFLFFWDALYRQLPTRPISSSKTTHQYKYMYLHGGELSWWLVTVDRIGNLQVPFNIIVGTTSPTISIGVYSFYSANVFIIMYMVYYILINDVVKEKNENIFVCDRASFGIVHSFCVTVKE